MASGVVVRRNQYYDSVFLMGVSKRISDIQGVQQNAVLMCSESNKELLASLGLRDTQIDAAQPNDLLVAVIGDAQAIVSDVLGRLDEFLAGGGQPSATSNPHPLEDGREQRPDANLAVISVPGGFAAPPGRPGPPRGLG